MSLLWLCLIWVFAAVGVAMLPVRRQFIPAGLLMLMAPVLIAAIGVSYGWILGALALAGFLSMFRNPLRYLLARLRGQNPELPK